MKRFLLKVCTFALTFTFIFNISSSAMRTLTPPIWYPYGTLTDNENLPVAKDNKMYPMESMGSTAPYGTAQKFTSNVDGYSILIPSDMTVDMSYSDIGAYFENENISLRVMKETFKTAGERESYLNYSNRFTLNTADHVVERQESYSSGVYTYHILQWTRKKLSAVENDKNYYANVDVCVGARVYTFFFKANAPFNTYGGYMDIVNSLDTFDPTVSAENAYNKGYKESGVSHLNGSAKRTYDKLFASDASFKMGMFAPDKFGGLKRMEEIENTIGYKFCAFLVYTEFPDRDGYSDLSYISRVNSYISQIESNLNYASLNDKAIELTLQTPLSRQSSKNMIYEILDGRYDDFIDAYAKMIARHRGTTVLFRPFNEMNSDWCNYSAYHTSRDPEIYVSLYKHLYNKFKQAGCDNVIWVWNPNEKSFPNYKWTHEALYYPGDEFVDVYGITGYNTGTYYSAEIWRSFDEIYAPIYERAERINEKPMMITEYACSAIGGDKVAWTEDMFKTLSKYDKIKVGIWWHAADYDGENLARPYFIDTPDGMLDVFKKYLGGN